MNDHKIKLGITQGDINGISYEIIIKSLMDNRILDICTPVVYGSAKVAAYHRKALDLDHFNFNIIRSADEINPKRANIINCIDDEIRVDLGKSTSAAGKASIDALMMAVTDLRDGKINALVTGPINKHNIQSDDFRYAGHTEFLRDFYDTDEVLMLMVSDLLKVGVVTGHIPLSKVAEMITPENILIKLRLLDHSLKQDFGIRKPKIAVLALNPHAGEEGILGTEENDIIIPTLEQARNEKLFVFGPFPSDGFFGSGDFTRFDGTLAMYHDQGLAPFKSIVPEDGVNFTAGLPVIRTSPAHGTAFEIAGKNEASHSSFLKSIYLACDIHKNRKLHKEITAQPLTSGEASLGE